MARMKTTANRIMNGSERFDLDIEKGTFVMRTRVDYSILPIP